MIGCLRTRVRKQPIIALYFESENELELYNLKARSLIPDGMFVIDVNLSYDKCFSAAKIMPPCYFLKHVNSQ